MTIPATFLPPGAETDDDDVSLGVVGKLTAEQTASLAAGLMDMEPIPAPSEMSYLTTAADGHPSVTCGKDAIQVLLAGATHPEVLDQLTHPDTMAEQLFSSRGRGRKNAPKRKVSRLGRLKQLSTDTCYAAVMHSPFHQIAGVKVLPVNPRFLAMVQHAFTKGSVTDPAIEGQTPGRLEIHLPTQQSLRDMMVQTVEHHLMDYDWSDSIARTGTQHPLTCMVMIVHYDDGTSELIVVCIDGQSRLVSAWRNILNISGKPLKAPEAREYAEKIVGRMFAHDAIASSRKTVNDALHTATTRSWTASEMRVLHSRLAPTNLVLGTFSRTGEPCDASRWFTEHLTQIHLRTRSWGGGSDKEKAVADALTEAVRKNLLTQQKSDALSGRLHGEAFANATRLPFHPAFARAALFATALSGEAGQSIRTSIAEYLSLDPNDDSFPKKLLEILAIFSTRFLRSDSKKVFPQMVNTWGDGGAITSPMWHRVENGEPAFTLTCLQDDLLHLDHRTAAQRLTAQLRERAKSGDTEALDELAVLGGDALIVADALNRDRGSKEDLISEVPVDKKTPYRAKPPTIVAALTKTAAGQLLLGEALSNWVDQVPGFPEDYSRGFIVPQIKTDPDGTPKVATSYGMADRASEWHVFETAEPGLPSRRRNQIEIRRNAARAEAAKNNAKSTGSAATIATLQTDIHRVERTIEKITTSTNPPCFDDEAQREAIQQLLWKLGGEIKEIPVAPKPVVGDPYAVTDQDDE
ncbi:hypothetical protein [Streptomyces similanensis]|uniref:Uncharacterized protein n=1 Tax=Streptomyces similanensis TaxID=1274988 RepID=A0ABP9L4J5_9ACTN